MKVTRKHLQQIIREELGRSSDRAGSGLPNARELLKKLSSVDPGEAIAFLARVLNNMNVSAPAPAPEPEPAPMPPAPEENE